MREFKTVIESRFVTGEPVLEVMKDGLEMDYSLSSRVRIGMLRKIICKDGPGDTLRVERGIYRYFLPPENKRTVVKLGLYRPEQEIWEQGHQGLDHNNPEFLVMAETLTARQIIMNLPKHGLRSATLEELIAFLTDDPKVALFRGVVALGTKKVDAKTGNYYPVFRVMNDCELVFASEYSCHRQSSRMKRRITHAYFLVAVI